MNDKAEEVRRTAEIRPSESYLKEMANDIRVLKSLVSEALVAMRQAEGEISEKMRRFVTYAHDVHDMCYMYEIRGLPVPDHLLREMERIDDRYRQLCTAEHAEGGTFARVRREMASDPANRWDHTRQLTGPKEKA